MKPRYKIILFWLVVYGAMFVFLQTHARFYLYYIEQNLPFENTRYYLITHLLKPAGGLASVAAGFLNGFFLFPYIGAAITGALLTTAGVLSYGIVRRITSQTDLLIACLLPVIALMLIHFNANYLSFGTIAFIMTLAALCVAFSMKDDRRRLVFHVLATGALFFAAGSVYVLYALTATIYELMNGSKHGYLILPVIVEAFFIGVAAVYFGVYTAYRFAFLPDNYFYYKWMPGTLVYLSWISVLLLVVVACLIRKKKIKMRKVFVTAQIVLVAGCCWAGIYKYGLKEKSMIMELDYYCRTEQWDKITERCKGPLNDYLSICYVNMALAQKGELGDKAFTFDQAGVEGLVYHWDKSAYASTLLSDIYFAMNDMALSQKMAFESHVISGNPRMLKRLVQTNLIYGAYPVAEKYISRLEQMTGYRGWAKESRRFLYNDAAIEQDEVLGVKRKSLVKDNYLSKIEGLDMDLQQLAIHNPADRSSIEYAGVMYLLAKDMDRFRQLIESNYQTDVLPRLPVSFQEAMLILSLKEPDYWKRYDIPETTVLRFSQFVDAATANSNDSRLQALLKPLYGDTYWFYYRFK